MLIRRFWRMFGTVLSFIRVPTYFLTGTDEHGQKVQQAAERNGISPQEQCINRSSLSGALAASGYTT